MDRYTTRFFAEQRQDDSHNVAYSGDSKLARMLLREYGIDKRWSNETLRARWDGTTALLGWWRDLPPAARPPLHKLIQDDARAFITSLEQRGLARSTIKSYRVGANSTCDALAARSSGAMCRGYFVARLRVLALPRGLIRIIRFVRSLYHLQLFKGLVCSAFSFA